MRIVDGFAPEHPDAGVLLQQIIEFLGAVSKGADDFSGHKVFLSAGDDPLLHQLHHGIGNHLGMNAQVVLVLERQRGCIGNAADAQLNAVTVIYQRSHVITDGHFQLIGGADGQIGQWSFGLHDHVHIPNMNLGVAIDPGQIGVHLENHPIRSLQKRLFVDQTQGNHKIAVAIHGSGGGDKDIAAVDLNPSTGPIVEVAGIIAEKTLLPALAGGTHQERDVHIKGILIDGVGEKPMGREAHGRKHPEVLSAAPEMVNGIEESRGLVGTLGGADDVAVLQGVQGFFYGAFLD